MSDDTNAGLHISSFTCTATGKEKIPGNMYKKAEGGMISCEEKKHKVYVSFEESFDSLEIGDEQSFTKY